MVHFKFLVYKIQRNSFFDGHEHKHTVFTCRVKKTMSSKKNPGDDESTDDEKPKPKKDKLQRQIEREEKSRQKREARLGKGNKNFAAISTGENKSIGRQNLAVSYEDRPANDPKCVDGKKVEKEKQKERDIEENKKQAGNDNMRSGRKNDDD